MNLNVNDKENPSNGHLILALHSCSETLGIAMLDLRAPEKSLISSTFPIGRSLSNNILNCLGELIPASHLHEICRLSVAIGPGGFTGTRITVVLARTLAQQLGCNLDGVSSFALMAPRLANQLQPFQQNKPFWIIKNLPRRGLIAGKYRVNNNSKNRMIEDVLELEKPHLLSNNLKPDASLNASDDVHKDVLRLLNIGLIKHQLKKKSSWQEVVPIYPTSPVENNHTNQ